MTLDLFSVIGITRDQEVFSFHSDHSPCNGLEETLSCYRKIAQNAKLAGRFSVPLFESEHFINWNFLSVTKHMNSFLV